MQHERGPRPSTMKKLEETQRKSITFGKFYHSESLVGEYRDYDPGSALSYKEGKNPGRVQIQKQR